MNPLITDFQTPQQRTPVIVALDFANEKDTLGFVRNLDPALCQIKIGKELFTATGRSLAESLIHQGFKLFLDLKYHDIPHTVAQACKVAADMGVWMVDMHASGGRRMMEAAAEAVAGYGTKPLLIGVTVLTSMEQSDLAEIGLNTAPEEQVIRLAKLAQSSGLDGVVCSAQAAPLRSGTGFCLGYTGYPLGRCRQQRRPTPHYDTRRSLGGGFDLSGDGPPRYPSRRSGRRIARSEPRGKP